MVACTQGYQMTYYEIICDYFGPDQIHIFYDGKIKLVQPTIEINGGFQQARWIVLSNNH